MHPGTASRMYGGLSHPPGCPRVRPSRIKRRVERGLESVAPDHAVSRHSGTDLRCALSGPVASGTKLATPFRWGHWNAKCVSVAAPPRQSVFPLPARDKRVAVIGGGLSGLTVAWDLCRKGYPIDLFDSNPRLGYYLINNLPRRAASRSG